MPVLIFYVTYCAFVGFLALFLFYVYFLCLQYFHVSLLVLCFLFPLCPLYSFSQFIYLSFLDTDYSAICLLIYLSLNSTCCVPLKKCTLPILISLLVHVAY